MYCRARAPKISAPAPTRPPSALPPNSYTSQTKRSVLDVGLEVRCASFDCTNLERHAENAYVPYTGGFRKDRRFLNLWLVAFWGVGRGQARTGERLSRPGTTQHASPDASSSRVHLHGTRETHWGALDPFLLLLFWTPPPGKKRGGGRKPGGCSPPSGTESLQWLGELGGSGGAVGGSRLGRGQRRRQGCSEGVG